MTEHTARVRYTEPMLRRAVRTFMWRRVCRRPWLLGAALVLVAIGLGLGTMAGPDFYTGVTLAAVLFFGIAVAAVWRAHLHNTVGRFRALDPPEADMVFRETDLVVTSSEGSATIPWSRVKEVWALPDCWLLFMAESQFMTLPLATLCPETRRFVASKLPPAS